METHNRSLASVGLVQIVFGLLCVCLQASVSPTGFLIYGSIFTRAIIST